MTATSPTPPPPATGNRRWLRWLLFVSLALNLLVVGVIAGTALSRRDGDRGPESSLVRDLGLGPFLWALSPEDRDELKREARAQGGPLRQRRGEMREAFGATLRALRAEPFDPAVFAALIETQAKAAEQGRKLGETLLVQQVAQMSSEERAALADRLENAVRRHGPRRNRQD